MCFLRYREPRSRRRCDDTAYTRSSRVSRLKSTGVLIVPNLPVRFPSPFSFPYSASVRLCSPLSSRAYGACTAVTNLRTQRRAINPPVGFYLRRWPMIDSERNKNRGAERDGGIRNNACFLLSPAERTARRIIALLRIVVPLIIGQAD